MASPRPSPSTGSRKPLAAAVALAFFGLAGTARADAPAGAYVSLDEASPAVRDLSEQRLFLEVFHGERPTGLIAEFRLRGDRLSTTPEEFAGMGLLLPADIASDDNGHVSLDAVPGLSWRYDVAAQRVHLAIPAALRPRQQLGYQPPTVVQAQRPPGWRVDYDAYGQHRAENSTLAASTGVSWFGRFGSLELLGVTHLADVPEGGTGRGFERLETRWSYSDPARMWTWTAGDLVSGGLAWTRPVRMGGVQWRRNFATRPDLVTVPLPRFSADATLPSAVELYVDNVRQFGGEVQDGPFVLDAIPSINGAGMAQLVVRDVLGRETTTSVPLYFDNQRLAEGLTDFSVELGMLRRGWGTGADDYDQAAASASWRRGVNETLTVEAHGEATAGLSLVGTGVVWSPGNRWGLLATSVSRSAGDSAGWQYSAGYQFNTRRWGLDLHSLRRTGGFRDLGDASVADLEGPTSARAEDRATFWVPSPLGDFAASWLHFEGRAGDRSTIRTVSWNRQFTRAYVTVTVFDDGRHTGGGLNLSMPLGRHRHASISVQHAGDAGADVVATYRQDVPYDGGWGWGAQVGDRGGGEARLHAAYQNDHVEALAGFDRFAGDTGAFAQAAGSVIGLGGDVFFSRRIHDAFALVSTGQPGVPVLYENRRYGTTDANGHLLIPQLRGWQRNRIAIDPDALPANFRVGEIERFATPTERGGVVVAFDVRALAPATAILLGRDGQPLAAGRRTIRDGGPGPLVGFDGTVYLESLDADTVLEVPLEDGVCRHTLPAVATGADGTPVRLGPVPCEWTSR